MPKYRKSKPGKLGPNEPCFCGSNVKYKKCCLPKGLEPLKRAGEIPLEVLEHLRKIEDNRAMLESKGIYVRYPNTLTHQGKSFLAVGNRVMWHPKPGLSFHELILWNLTMTLGKEWWDEESKKTSSERHFIRRCFDEIRSKPSAGGEFHDVTNNLRSFVATGNMQSMISLAFDLYLLTHKGFMPEEWLHRLRDQGEYQGVRYEIAVASLFVRIGSDLEFYPLENPKRYRPEFIARHVELNTSVAVEAKSRRRAGVINEKGEANLRKAMRGDVQKLFNKALKKEVDDLPYLIFIDVNAPNTLDEDTIETRWFTDIQKMFDSYETPTAENPQKQNALIATNYSFHYDGNDVARGAQFTVAFGLHPRTPLAGGIENPLFDRLMRATANYGYIPPNIDL